MLALSRDDVRRLVPIDQAISSMKVAFADLSAGRAVAPLRTAITVQPETATTLVMPAFVPAVDALGLKVVSVFRGNVARGLPTITSLVTLIDVATGVPLAIMDGGYLTALRTGAVSGAATDLLARQDSRVLTVIGAGAQAVTQAAAVCAVRPIERVLVVARGTESFDRYAQAIRREWPALASRIEFVPDVGAAVRAADVICTATTSATPVFDHADVRPGTHINGVGSFSPEMQEIPSATIAAALVIVDQFEAALEEAGDLIVPLRDGDVTRAHIRRELGQLVAGDIEGRSSPEQITVFKSVGNAVQDMAVGRYAYEEALRLGVGDSLDLF